MPDTTVKSAEARLLQALRTLGSPERAGSGKSATRSRAGTIGASRCRRWTSRSRRRSAILEQEQALDLCPAPVARTGVGPQDRRRAY